MDYTSQVYLLSHNFYQDYPASKYPELLHKEGRPYTCLLIDSHEGYFICVPFRSNINHNNSFLFVNTARSKKSHSGLDYSKIAIICNMDYIDSTKAAVTDNDEYVEMETNLQKITEEVLLYVNNYINHINGTKPLHPREFNRRYNYSTLRYFHNILGCEK